MKPTGGNESLENTLLSMEHITRNPLTQTSADEFLRYLNSSPELKNDPRTQELMETFEIQLSGIQASWAQEKITALGQFRLERSQFAGTVSAWTPEGQEVSGDTGFFSLTSLSRIGVDAAEVQRVTQKAIGSSLTSDLIRNYQKDQKIGVDGKIGVETYIEMLAPEVGDAFKDRIETQGVSLKTQERILFVLKHGNFRGKNVGELTLAVASYKTVLEKDPNFQEKYGSFYGEIEKYSKKENGGLGGDTAKKEAENTRGTNGKTLWENLKEGNLEEIIKNPTLLFAAGALFLFGAIGGDTKYTDSILKRIGWIFGGMMFGPKIWGELVGPALADGKEYLRSPEAQTAVATGRDKAGNIFKDAIDWAGKTWDEVSSTVMGEYDAFTKSMESKNETFKNSADASEKAKYIDKISEKQSLIFSDEKFLNTPVSTLQAIDHSDTGLASVISPETYAKLELSGNDAKNFIELYILPKIEEAQKAGGAIEKWSDVYLPANIRETAQTMSEDIVTWMALPFVASASLDTEIKTELSTLMYTGTPAQKDAAKNLAYRLSLGKYSEFKVENFPELSSTEKDIFTALLVKIGNILIQEKILQNYETQIQNEVSLNGISIITAPILEERWSKLQAIKNNYTAKRDTIVAVGVTTETLDVVFAGKERELLEAALENGITSLGGNNVVDTLQQVDTKEAVANGVSIMQEYLENLEAPPPVTATPIELKAWYERNREAFDEASKIETAGNLPAGSNEALIADAAKKILERKTAFVDQYETTKENYVTKFTNLNTAVTGFDTASITEQNFDAKQKELAGLSNTYSQYMSEIEASWITDVSSKITGKISDWWNGTYSFESSSNAFIIDGIESEKPAPDTLVVETSLKTKAEELKKKFDVISEVKIGNITIVSIKPELDPIIANIRTKLEVSDPERYNIFKDAIQDAKVVKVSDLLKVFDILIKAIEQELSLTQDQGAKDVLQTQVLLFKQAREEIVGKIKGSLTQDAIAWIEKLYGSVDDYYQSLIK